MRRIRVDREESIDGLQELHVLLLLQTLRCEVLVPTELLQNPADAVATGGGIGIAQ